VSTRIGIIAEGPIDHALIPPLLSRIAEVRANFRWPLDAQDVADFFPLRRRGHGGVLETVRRLVNALDTQYFDHACFVILLDKKTLNVQTEVRRLISGKDRFVLGIAIKEIEAWWLGDRSNTLNWSGFAGGLPPDCRYAAGGYLAETDDNPKRTLDELTQRSKRFDRFYGQGSLDLATEFAEDFWRRNAHLDEIAGQCPNGFVPFRDQMTNSLRRARARNGYLLR